MKKEKNKWLKEEAIAGTSRSARAAFFQIIKGVLVVAVAASLARMLDPSDFGVVATMAPVIALVQLFALVQLLKNFASQLTR